MFISALLVLASVWILAISNQNDANAWWNADMWINNSFREQNPSDGNIIAALFGNWYPWSSPYNRYWSGFCLPNKITYVQNMNQIQNMVRDTIYVIEDGFYYIDDDIIPANCSAIIGEWTGEVILEGAWIKISGKTNVILDNLIIDWDPIKIENSHDSTINNIEIKNTYNGLILTKSYNNRINRLKSHDNTYWITDKIWSKNFFSECEFFNNDYGLYNESTHNNIINNCQIYNNNQVWVFISWSIHNSINNSQIYNNIFGVYLASSSKNVINNSNIYSNSFWIQADGDFENLLMSGNIYNNTRWFSLNNGKIRYYNKIGLFGNSNDCNMPSNLIKWWYEDEAHYEMNTDLLVLLRPSVWNFDTTMTLNRFLRTYPVDKRWIKFITPLSDFLRWTQNWNPEFPIKYIAWKQIIKQVRPIWFAVANNNSWWALLYEHNPDYFIASIDSETSELDDSIISYYYWNYQQESEFTKNWNEKNCNINVMTVEYINDQTWFNDKLLASNMPLWHTIYVIWDGEYNVTDSITIENDCTAIVNYKWSGAILKYYLGTESLYSMIYVDGHENIVFDWLSLDWNHNSNNNILLERYESIPSQNSTINGIQSFNSLWNGIQVWMLWNYNTIMNSKIWNNLNYWIDLYLAWEHNIINNSISYNNQSYGIRFGNKSKYNSINNSQFFNNGIGWIFSDLNTESNIINNVHSYNNHEYWLNFKWSSGNTLNKIYSYNNGIWINIEDDSAINNIYISDIYIFANRDDNLRWTNWHDIFLYPWYIYIPWVNTPTPNKNTTSKTIEWEDDWSDNDVNLVADLSNGIWIDDEITPDDETKSLEIENENNDSTTNSNDESNSESHDIYKSITKIMSWYYFKWNEDPAWTESYEENCTGKITTFMNSDFLFGIDLCEQTDNLYEFDNITISNIAIKDTDMDDFCEYKIDNSFELSFETNQAITGISVYVWENEVPLLWEWYETGWIIHSWDTIISEWNYIYSGILTKLVSWLSGLLTINYTIWNNTWSAILSWFNIVFVDYIPGEDEIYIDLRDSYWFEVIWKMLYLQDSSIFVLSDKDVSPRYPLHIWKCSAIIGQENSTLSTEQTGTSIVQFDTTSIYSVLEYVSFALDDGSENKTLQFENNFTEFYTIVNNSDLNKWLLTKLDSNMNYNYYNTYLPNYIKFLPKSWANLITPDTYENEIPWDIISELDMSCQYATNIQNSNTLFFQNGACDTIWVIPTRSPIIWFNNTNYIFGVWISKQISPVWYYDKIMRWLDNQYITTSYIWETNPILYTDPGSISFSGAFSNEIDTGINYEIDVFFTNQWVINHNFNIKLTFNTPENIEWHLEIKNNWSRENVWYEIEDVDYTTFEALRIVIKTPDTYLQEIEGSLYIWTDEYWNNSEIFWMQTIAEPIKPEIIRLKNIQEWWVRDDTDNIRQVKVNWKHTVKARYDYVNFPEECNSGITTNEYNDLSEINLTDYHLGADTLNKKYVCIYAKDIVNNKVSTWISNQIKISSVNFVDDIIPWPSYYDSVGISFENAYNYGYTWVINKWKCNGEITQWMSRIPYNGNFIINNDKYNNKYLCVKAEDSLWHKKYFTSENSVNIIWHGDVVYFEDWVNPSRNNEDIISIWFSNDVEFIEKSYKRVSNILECSNTWWMIPYNKTITIDNKYLNWYYFCLYTLESWSLIENYLISPSPLKVDNTNPTSPTIISPNDNDSIYYLIIELTWATDSDAGIAWYEYQISKDTTFMNIADQWFIATSENIISPKFDWEDGLYAIRIRAIDKAWNISNTWDNIPYILFHYNNFSGLEFTDITWADLWKYYMSNTIIIQWLWISGSAHVEVSNWVLYRNGVSKWTGTTIFSGDSLSIRMQSSDSYDTKTVAQLILFNKVIPRTITTKEQNPIAKKYNISEEEIESVQKIFNSMINMYNDEWERMEMFYTMKSLLNDEISLKNNDTNKLQYLAYLIDNYLNDSSENWLKIHTAPNCKKYEISYNEKIDWYYSPDMMVTNGKISYFATVTDLLRFIDSKNVGWECGYHLYKKTYSHANSDVSKHIAPNWKIYTIEYTKLWYTSSELSTTKYFASIYDLKSHINSNNPNVTLLTRDHTVDTGSSAETYTAPNWKSYVIYHTDKWYMSYKFMSVRYFESLEEMKAYIDKNNKK